MAEVIFKKKYPDGYSRYYTKAEFKDRFLTISLYKSNDDDFIKYSENPSIFTTSLITPSDPVSTLTIDLTNLFKTETCFGVYKNSNDELINPREMYATRDSDFVFRSLHRIEPDEKYALAIYFNNSIDECLVIGLKYPTLPTDYSISPTQYNSNVDVILAKYPSYERVLKLKDARRAILVQLDPNDTLSGLEAQLDILTSLVLAMIKAQPDTISIVEKIFPRIHDFEAIFDEINVITVKDVDKCIEEIKNNKSFIRLRQKEYYQTKEIINKEQ